MNTTIDNVTIDNGTSSTASSIPSSPRWVRWTGRVVSAVPVLFLTLDGIGKLAMPAPVKEGTESLGYSTSVIVPLGIVTLACLALHLYRRTAVLGAVLLTGYLGGAVATHVRVGSPVFSHILFPVYLGIFIWLGLYLRDRRVRGLLS